MLFLHKPHRWSWGFLITKITNKSVTASLYSTCMLSQIQDWWVYVLGVHYKVFSVASNLDFEFANKICEYNFDGNIKKILKM